MNITIKFLKEKNACMDGIEYFINNKFEGIGVFDLINKLLDDDEVYYVNWLISRTLTPTNCVLYLVYAAELVLPIFEAYNKEDKRPRLAIETSKNYVKNPTEENRMAALAAADAARAAADAATAVYADDAARAAWAALAAATAATADTADTAVYADDAAWAAYKETMIKIINHGIELLKKQEHENQEK